MPCYVNDLDLHILFNSDEQDAENDIDPTIIDLNENLEESYELRRDHIKKLKT